MVDITISMASSHLTLDQGRGSVTASVTNRSTSPERVVLAVYPPPGAAASGDPRSWATVVRPLREIPPGATEQYVVAIDAADLTEGAHQVKVVAYPADRAPEEYSDRGQLVTVDVPPAPAPEEKPRRRWWIWVVAAVALIAVVGLVIALLSRSPEPEPEPTLGVIVVPDLVGLSEAQAEAALGEDLALTTTLEGSNQAVGTVLGQDPGAGAELQAGQTVRVVVSGVAVPDLGGLTEERAAAALADEGLRLSGVSSVRDQRSNSPFSEADIGTVVRQDPNAGEVVGLGAPVSIGILTSVG